LAERRVTRVGSACVGCPPPPWGWVPDGLLCASSSPMCVWVLGWPPAAGGCAFELWWWVGERGRAAPRASSLRVGVTTPLGLSPWCLYLSQLLTHVWEGAWLASCSRGCVDLSSGGGWGWLAERCAPRVGAACVGCPQPLGLSPWCMYMSLCLCHVCVGAWLASCSRGCVELSSGGGWEWLAERRTTRVGVCARCHHTLGGVALLVQLCQGLYHVYVLAS
jgi:hypothetical protein